MSEEKKEKSQQNVEKIKVGFIVDAVNENVLATVKKQKMSMINLRILAKLEKEINDEFAIYRKVVNDYILQNGVGEGQDKKIDTSNQIAIKEFTQHIIDLRNQDSNVDKLSKPLFTEKDLEEKNMELSLIESRIYFKFGIINIDPDEGLYTDKSEEEITEEIQESEVSEE